MLITLLQMFALIALGLAWSLRPGGASQALGTRTVIADLVFYLFLPALVLDVLWRARLDADSLAIAASAAGGVLGGLLLAWALCGVCRMPAPRRGALLLASAFPNATYMGLPVLEGLFGDRGRSIAIQYDLFACTPLLLSLGVVLAARLGSAGHGARPWSILVKVPALWAAALAVVLNLSGIQEPEALRGLLQRMGAAVVPLMLFSVGMALRDGLSQGRRLGLVSPVLVIQLLLMPAGVWWLASVLGLSGITLGGVVLEAAMPTMAFGVVLADRYGLDTGLFAAAVLFTTLLSMATLPGWHWALQAG